MNRNFKNSVNKTVVMKEQKIPFTNLFKKQTENNNKDRDHLKNNHFFIFFLQKSNNVFSER